MDIKIVGQKKSAFIDTRPPDLFISKKIVGKLDLLVSESTKKIKTVNSKEVPTVGIVQGVELQINQ